MDTMGLVGAATAMSQATLDGQVQIAVAKKMMDMQRETGSAAISNLLNAANTGIDKAASQMVAATTGLGGSLDVQA